MSRHKIEADRTNKRLIKTRIEALEKKSRLLEAVVANLVRDTAMKGEMTSLLKAQPGATVEAASAPSAPTLSPEAQAQFHDALVAYPAKPKPTGIDSTACPVTDVYGPE